MKKKQRRMFSGRTLLLAIIALFLGFNIYSWNAETVIGNKMPMPFHYGMATVLSGSMEPQLSVNDLVIIREIDEVQVGDIVVFQSGEILVIHRVIEIDKDTIITKGDANNMADSPITKADIKGVLVWQIPYAGNIVRILKQPWMIVLMIVFAFLLVEGSFRKEKEKDKEELDEIQNEIKLLLEEMNRNKETKK